MLYVGQAHRGPAPVGSRPERTGGLQEAQGGRPHVGPGYHTFQAAQAQTRSQMVDTSHSGFYFKLGSVRLRERITPRTRQDKTLSCRGLPCVHAEEAGRHHRTIRSDGRVCPQRDGVMDMWRKASLRLVVSEDVRRVERDYVSAGVFRAVFSRL
jgi:hypothetical protein